MASWFQSLNIDVLVLFEPGLHLLGLDEFKEAVDAGLNCSFEKIRVLDQSLKIFLSQVRVELDEFCWDFKVFLLFDSLVLRLVRDLYHQLGLAFYLGLDFRTQSGLLAEVIFDDRFIGNITHFLVGLHFVTPKTLSGFDDFNRPLLLDGIRVHDRIRLVLRRNQANGRIVEFHHFEYFLIFFHIAFFLQRFLDRASN